MPELNHVHQTVINVLFSRLVVRTVRVWLPVVPSREHILTFRRTRVVLSTVKVKKASLSRACVSSLLEHHPPPPPPPHCRIMTAAPSDPPPEVLQQSCLLEKVEDQGWIVSCLTTSDFRKPLNYLKSYPSSHFASLQPLFKDLKILMWLFQSKYCQVFLCIFSIKDSDSFHVFPK